MGLGVRIYCRTIRVDVALWLRVLALSHLIIDRLQSALEHRAMPGVGGPAQLPDDAGARESERFKFGAPGALLNRRSTSVGAGIGGCLLPFEHLFHLAGQIISIPTTHGAKPPGKLLL